LFHVVYHLGLRGSRPHIIVRVQREGEAGVRFVVHHRGWTLSPEELRRWEQGMQGPDASWRLREEMPLPPVVAALARRLGGRVTLEGTPSQGTKVLLHFPG